MKRKKFLFIDDNVGATQLFTAAAEIIGVEPVACTDGLTALKYVNREHFDAIILDLSMPEMDGLSVAEAIRQAEMTRLGSKPSCIVFYTAQTIDGAIERVGNKVGVKKMYQKPYDMLQLLAEVIGLCGNEEKMEVKSQAKERGHTNQSALIATVGIVGLILVVSYFNYAMNAQKRDFDNTLHVQQETAAYQYSNIKAQRDQLKGICEDNALLSQQKDKFIEQNKLSLPPQLAGQKTCTAAVTETK